MESFFDAPRAGEKGRSSAFTPALLGLTDAPVNRQFPQLARSSWRALFLAARKAVGSIETKSGVARWLPPHSKVDAVPYGVRWQPKGDTAFDESGFLAW